MQPQPASGNSALASHVDRREFLHTAVHSVAVAGTLPVLCSLGESAGAANAAKPPIIDTHMHVWANDPRRYPFPHPYVKDFKGAPHPGTVEMLIKDMDQHGCTHAVLVQVIYHGWDNSYVADCAKRFPKRLKAHGLIDPTDPRVADKLEYWVKKRGLHGMRFSAIYYQDGRHGGDAWLDARETRRLWKKADKLGAVFNFFISPRQLPRLAKMVRAFPKVKVVVDHFSQVDLGAKDPEPDFKLLLSMARYRNVWVKISELSSVSKSGKYPFADALPHVRRVYEAFGPDRLLFGTGYPGEARAAYNRPTLDKEIDLIRKETPFFSKEDSEKILGRNAARLWGFS